MNTKFEKLFARSWSERWVLLQAMILLPICWVGLRAIGLSRLHSWVARAPAAAAQPDVDPIAFGTLVDIAARHGPFYSTCLTRSLVLIWLLQRRGLRSELRIGVRMIETGIDSHAWVECEGKTVNDAPGFAGRYTVFGDPPSRRARASR
jgi:hypothetical protein